MFTKILIITAVAAVTAVKIHDYDHVHGHGHASGILINQHEDHHQQIHEPHHKHEHYHIQQEPLTIPSQLHETHQGHHEDQGHHEKQHVDYYAEPNYEYEYQVKDPHTHDIKQQHESRHGDVVKGEYSLHQPDGTVRIVKYHADKKTGFHADVNYSGHTIHIVPEHRHHPH